MKVYKNCLRAYNKDLKHVGYFVNRDVTKFVLIAPNTLFILSK